MSYRFCYLKIISTYHKPLTVFNDRPVYILTPEQSKHVIHLLMSPHTLTTPRGNRQHTSIPLLQLVLLHRFSPGCIRGTSLNGSTARQAFSNIVPNDLDFFHLLSATPDSYPPIWDFLKQRLTYSTFFDQCQYKHPVILPTFISTLEKEWTRKFVIFRHDIAYGMLWSVGGDHEKNIEHKFLTDDGYRTRQWCFVGDSIHIDLTNLIISLNNVFPSDTVPDPRQLKSAIRDLPPVPLASTSFYGDLEEVLILSGEALIVTTRPQELKDGLLKYADYRAKNYQPSSAVLGHFMALSYERDHGDILDITRLDRYRELHFNGQATLQKAFLIHFTLTLFASPISEKTKSSYRVALIPSLEKFDLTWLLDPKSVSERLGEELACYRDSKDQAILRTLSLWPRLLTHFQNRQQKNSAWKIFGVLALELTTLCNTSEATPLSSTIAFPDPPACQTPDHVANILIPLLQTLKKQPPLASPETAIPWVNTLHAILDSLLDQLTPEPRQAFLESLLSILNTLDLGAVAEGKRLIQACLSKMRLSPENSHELFRALDTLEPFIEGSLIKQNESSLPAPLLTQWADRILVKKESLSEENWILLATPLSRYPNAASHPFKKVYAQEIEKRVRTIEDFLGHFDERIDRIKSIEDIETLVTFSLSWLSIEKIPVKNLAQIQLNLQRLSKHILNLPGSPWMRIKWFNTVERTGWTKALSLQWTHLCAEIDDPTIVSTMMASTTTLAQVETRFLETLACISDPKPLIPFFMTLSKAKTKSTSKKTNRDSPLQTEFFSKLLAHETDLADLLIHCLPQPDIQSTTLNILRFTMENAAKNSCLVLRLVKCLSPSLMSQNSPTPIQKMFKKWATLPHLRPMMAKHWLSFSEQVPPLLWLDIAKDLILNLADKGPLPEEYKPLAERALSQLSLEDHLDEETSHLLMHRYSADPIPKNLRAIMATLPTSLYPLEEKHRLGLLNHLCQILKIIPQTQKSSPICRQLTTNWLSFGLDQDDIRHWITSLLDHTLVSKETLRELCEKAIVESTPLQTSLQFWVWCIEKGIPISTETILKTLFDPILHECRSSETVATTLYPVMEKMIRSKKPLNNLLINFFNRWIYTVMTTNSLCYALAFLALEKGILSDQNRNQAFDSFEKDPTPKTESIKIVADWLATAAELPPASTLQWTLTCYLKSELPLNDITISETLLKLLDILFKQPLPDNTSLPKALLTYLVPLFQRQSISEARLETLWAKAIINALPYDQEGILTAIPDYIDTLQSQGHPKAAASLFCAICIFYHDGARYVIQESALMAENNEAPDLAQIAFTKSLSALTDIIGNCLERNLLLRDHEGGYLSFEISVFLLSYTTGLLETNIPEKFRTFVTSKQALLLKITCQLFERFKGPILETDSLLSSLLEDILPKLIKTTIKPLLDIALTVLTTSLRKVVIQTQSQQIALLSIGWALIESILATQDRTYCWKIFQVQKLIDQKMNLSLFVVIRTEEDLDLRVGSLCDKIKDLFLNAQKTPGESLEFAVHMLIEVASKTLRACGTSIGNAHTPLSVVLTSTPAVQKSMDELMPLLLWGEIINHAHGDTYTRFLSTPSGEIIPISPEDLFIKLRHHYLDYFGDKTLPNMFVSAMAYSTIFSQRIFEVGLISLGSNAISSSPMPQSELAIAYETLTTHVLASTKEPSVERRDALSEINTAIQRHLTEDVLRARVLAKIAEIS